MKIHGFLIAYAVGGLSLCISAPSTAQSNEGCGDFDNEKVHLNRVYLVPRPAAARFHKRLEEWGTAQRLSVVTVGPATSSKKRTKQTTTTFLTASGERAVMIFETTNHDDRAVVKIQSNCWPPTDDWRRYRNLIIGQLASWKYRELK